MMSHIIATSVFNYCLKAHRHLQIVAKLNCRVTFLGCTHNLVVFHT